MSRLGYCDYAPAGIRLGDAVGRAFLSLNGSFVHMRTTRKGSGDQTHTNADVGISMQLCQSPPLHRLRRGPLATQPRGLSRRPGYVVSAEQLIMLLYCHLMYVIVLLFIYKVIRLYY